jgi:hypothetical protein
MSLSAAFKRALTIQKYLNDNKVSGKKSEQRRQYLKQTDPRVIRANTPLGKFDPLNDKSNNLSYIFAQ